MCSESVVHPRSNPPTSTDVAGRMGMSPSGICGPEVKYGTPQGQMSSLCGSTASDLLFELPQFMPDLVYDGGDILLSFFDFLFDVSCEFLE